MNTKTACKMSALLFKIPVANAEVCALCTNGTRCCRRGVCAAPRVRVIHPFRFPIGLGYYKGLPCTRAPGLGRDHAWLPVTHIGGPRKGPTDSGGLWFYYALGCSDLLWDAGRTLLARNRVHLAVEIERQLNGGDDRAAVVRVAEWVRIRYPKWPALGRARRGLNAPNATVETILAQTARGLFSSPCSGANFDALGALRPCVCGGPPSSRRLNALSSIAGDKHLLLHTEPLVVRLAKYDTLQLQQQPLGGGAHDFTSEVWDVRDSAAFLRERLLSRHLENASRFPRLYARRARYLTAGVTAAAVAAAVGDADAEATPHATPRPAAGPADEADPTLRMFLGGPANSSSRSHLHGRVHTPRLGFGVAAQESRIPKLMSHNPAHPAHPARGVGSSTLAPCVPSKEFHTCMSCRGSALERACATPSVEN